MLESIRSTIAQPPLFADSDLVTRRALMTDVPDLLRVINAYAARGIMLPRTEFEMAQEQLHRRRVVTPISGNIVEIARDVGEACQAYQPLIRVVDTRRCYFVSNVEAGLGSALKAAQSVRLELETSSTVATVRGSISYLSPVVDPASGLQRVKVLFENADGAIRPGVSGRMLVD